MKSERGVTLSGLVAYITVFIIILSIIATITSYFYKNVNQIQPSPRYITEFNKFSMFFVADVKKNSSIQSVTNDNLEFADGTKYSYIDGIIYRNDKKIAQYVQDFKFTEGTYTSEYNMTTKKIINVNTTIGFGPDVIKRNIDFVLKYW